MTPLMKMHTLGHDFVPDPIHAGGLRYHGMSPLISHLYATGEIEALAKNQSDCFAAGVLFARAEGIVPAPEPTHALAATIEEAERCKESGEEKVILTALCGHGHLDLAAYDAYLSGAMTDPCLGRRRSAGLRGAGARKAAGCLEPLPPGLLVLRDRASQSAGISQPLAVRLSKYWALRESGSQ